MSETLDQLTQLLREHLVPVPQGKVRDSYLHPRLGMRGCFVTDRISAFDFVLDFELEGHGAGRNAATVHWKRKLEAAGIRTDLRYYGPTIDEYLPPELQGIPELWKRFTWVHDADMHPVEHIKRNRLAGSAYAEYAEKWGCVYGQQLRRGYQKGDLLDYPLWTPTTKAPVGEHDEPLDALDVGAKYPHDTQLAQAAFDILSAEARRVGRAEFVDTKLEFGEVKIGSGPFLAVCDEVGTFDSSRIWRRSDAASRKMGELCPPVDKDFLRQKLVLLGIKGLDPKDAAHRQQVSEMRLTDEDYETLKALSLESLEITTGMTLDTLQRTVLNIPQLEFAA